MRESEMTKILRGPLQRALILESPHNSLDDYLREGNITPIRVDQPLSESEIIELVNKEKIQVIFKRSRIKITEKIVQNCPTLFAIQLCSIGTDSVDLKACAREGIAVFNDPVSNGRSVAELTMAQILALSRRLYEANELAHKGVWDKNSHQRYEVRGKVLGIIGLGNIGRQVAKLASALGMEVQFYDNRPVAVEVGREIGWRVSPSLEDLFSTSDYVTVHTSAQDYRGHDNTNFLDPYLELLGRDRPSEHPRIFINLARGNLHSSEALLKAVQSGKITRAAVDVYPSEPSSKSQRWENPYADEKRIVCSPHIGAATAEAQPRIARRVSRTILNFSTRGAIRDCVFSPKTELSISEELKNKTVLAVIHSTVRGTKKAIDDAIYKAGIDNIGSVHRDFPIGVAYDLSLIERPLDDGELRQLLQIARSTTGLENTILSIRQIEFDSRGNPIASE